MKHEVVKNKILILQDELDIYDAPILKEKIAEVAASHDSSVILDLDQVEGVSTPVIQVLMSARKSLKDFTIVNIHEGVRKNCSLFGYTL